MVGERDKGIGFLPSFIPDPGCRVGPCRMPRIKSLFRAFVARRTFRRTEIMKSETQGTYSTPVQDRASASRPGQASERVPVSSSEEIGKSPDDVSRRDDNGAVAACPPSPPFLFRSPSLRLPPDRPLSFLTPINTSPTEIIPRNLIGINVALAAEDLRDEIVGARRASGIPRSRELRKGEVLSLISWVSSSLRSLPYFFFTPITAGSR